MNRGLPAPLLVKNFQRQGMQWELKPEVRNMATFTKLNLIERWPPLPQFDIVFLRNVLIYFAPETKKAILEKVRKVMAPKAVLFLGLQKRRWVWTRHLNESRPTTVFFIV